MAIADALRDWLGITVTEHLESLATLSPEKLRKKLQASDLINARDAEGMTLLHYIAAGEADHRNLLIVLSHGADTRSRNSQGNTPLIEAALHGQVRKVSSLLAAGAPVNDVNDRSESALSSATAWGHLAVVEVLLKQNASTETRDVDGATALLFAANFGYLAILRALLHAGADKTVADHFGNNIGIHAVWSNKPEIVDEVYRTTGPLVFRVPNDEGISAIDYAEVLGGSVAERMSHIRQDNGREIGG